MNILEIYKKYKLPERLQLHMIRVAACAKLVLENWNEKINKEEVIRICLLHDMGNMAKISDEQIEDEEFRAIRKYYIDKYGLDDHKINLIIAKQEGLTDYELEILNKKQLRYDDRIAKSDSYELKICAYCDQRVAPKGVDTLIGRLEELRKRHINKPNGSMHDPETAKRLIKSALEIEDQVMKKCSIRKEDINEENIKKYVEDLKKYDIKKK